MTREEVVLMKHIWKYLVNLAESLDEDDEELDALLQGIETNVPEAVV